MRSSRKIAILLGSITLVCFVVYTWVLPIAINKNLSTDFVEKKILEISGYKTDLGDLKVSSGIFPYVWIKSDKFALLNNDNTNALFLQNPQIKLNLIPLLFRKINISKCNTDKEIINFVLTKDKKFLIGQYPIKIDKKKPEISLEKLKGAFGAYSIVLDDRLNSKKVRINGQYLNRVDFINKKHLQLNTKGKLTIDKKSNDYELFTNIGLPLNNLTKNKIKFNADIPNFDLSLISDYINIFTNSKIKRTSGIVDIHARTLNNKLKNNILANIKTKDLAIVGEDKASSIIYPKDLTIRLDFDTLNNGINFNNSFITSDKIHIYADGKVTNLDKKIPQLDLTTTVKNTRIEDVVAIIPGLKTIPPEFNLYKLKEYVFYGDAKAKLHFKGIANRPHVNGDVKLSDAYLVKPIPGASGNAQVYLKFIGQKMKLDVFVPATNNQSVKVTGDVKIDGSKYSELQIKSTPNVVLTPVQSVLIPLHEILKFQLGPVPIMKISGGTGNIDMHSAGKKVDPHIWGTINFKNATASFNDIHNMVLKNGSGEVLFNDTKTTFKTTSGTINGRPVEIKGDCTVLGKLNVFVTSKGHNIPYMIKVINTSPVLKEVQQVVVPFKNPDGIADLYLNIYGTAKDAEKVEFNKDLFSKGTITFHNATTTLQDTFLPIKNINGVVNFDKYDSDYDVTGLVRNSKLHVKGTGTKSDIDLVATSDKFKVQDISDMLYPNMMMPYKKEMGLLNVSFTGYYKGTVVNNQLDYNKVKVDGKFLSNINTKDPIKLNGGNFTIRNGNLNSQNLKGLFYENPFTLSFNSSDIYTTMKITDADFNFKDFDTSSINAIKHEFPLPKEIKAQLNNIGEISGKTDIKGTVKNGNIIADTDLSGLKFVYKPINAVVRIISGETKVRGDKLYLNRINSNVSSMPAFLTGQVSNIYSDNPYFNLSVSAKPTQRFFDYIYNAKAVYPVKVKGDINFNSKISGTFNSLNTLSTLNIGENSSLYYMGAIIEGAPTGDVTEHGIATNPVNIVLNSTLYPNKIRVNALNVNQMISSQNKRRFLQNQLNAHGEISLLKNNILKFNNFRIKTFKPVNARIFNILAKKPTIKQGVFTTDLLINGTSLSPSIYGFLNITSVDIPLFDSTLRDINVKFDRNYINMLAKGTILTNDITASAKIKNRMIPPYVVENLNIQTDELNLNTIVNALNDFEADNTRTKSQNSTPQLIAPNQIVINNATINADKILIEKANATNFQSHLTLGHNQVFDVDDFHFNLANGKVNGKINYNLNTFEGKGEMHIDNADAEIIAENFFDMPGQMYGLVTGSMNVACTGLSGVDCVNTLSGDGHFEVKDGRMPKLGSLEYLLKAGNLITGGITGLSINGIIDLITPLKTGNFESISGNIKVENGIANNINIYSKGKDLNMYLTGTYNISTLVADMEIYGSLSKNFSTLLGKIGNTSLLRLFNTIPGISINEINPKSTSNINKIPNFDKTNVLRVFKADIYGDINGSNYVKSFKWIRH